jgi:hypothetical protein
MRYFDYATRNDGMNGWDDIKYIGFPSDGTGTIYLKDGTTKAYYHGLKFALTAVEEGTWVEVFPFAQVNEYRENTTFISTEAHDDDFLASIFDTPAEDEDKDRDFLVTATVQVVVRAEDRVIARLIAAETLRDYISDSPYPNDVMNGLTIDDVEDLMEQD